MGESVAPRPLQRSTTAPAPRMGVTTAARPRQGVTVGAAGSVPAQVAVKIRENVTVVFPFEPTTVGVPAVTQQVTAAFPLAVTILQEGGAFANDLAVTLPPPDVTVQQTVAVYQSVTATFPGPTATTQARSEQANTSDMRMTKSGSQTMTPFNQDAKITSWAADPAYPMTVIVDNCLVADGGGTSTLSGSVNWSYNFGRHRVKVWQLRDGVTTAVYDSGNQQYPGGSKPISFSFPQATKPGDRYWLTMNTDQNYSGSGVVTSSSWLQLVK